MLLLPKKVVFTNDLHKIARMRIAMSLAAAGVDGTRRTLRETPSTTLDIFATLAEKSTLPAARENAFASLNALSCFTSYQDGVTPILSALHPSLLPSWTESNLDINAVCPIFIKILDTIKNMNF
jgi:hypothetical protein